MAAHGKSLELRQITGPHPVVVQQGPTAVGDVKPRMKRRGREKECRPPMYSPSMSMAAARRQAGVKRIGKTR
jgi:hypothetical protein